MTTEVQPLPIRVEGYGRRRRYVATLELDADECENIADALGPNDSGAAELLVTAERMRAMVEEDA